MTSSVRRDLLKGGAAGLLFPVNIHARPLAGPKVSNNPFSLGVASGEPVADGCVIWTRLAPKPLSSEPGAGMPPIPAEVEWIISDDENLRHVVQTGRTFAEPKWAHSVHVEVSGLKPDRPYWYGFRTRDSASPIGRARTAPRAENTPQRLRFAFASCQNFEHGYYAAWRHLAAQNPDLILHLGDYIYERSGTSVVRSHANTQEARDLSGYRARYAQYKSDPDLQRAHAATSWLVTWDDHEVDNDYAGLQGTEKGNSVAKFRARRAAAYQAWWEHMPVRRAMQPIGESLPLFRKLLFGQLAEFHMLDNRQYRSDQPCGNSLKRGGQVTGDCDERHDPSRSLLGRAQEQWLMSGLKSSRAKWNVLAQSMMMATLDQDPGEDQAWWTDGWDGYPVSRNRLLGFIDQQQVRNLLVISGDIHSFWANELKSPTNENRVVAAELVGSSISSRSISHKKFSKMLPDNPHVKFFDARRRGFVMCDLDAHRCTSEFHAVDDVTQRHSSASRMARFVVEDGRPKIQKD